MNRAYPQCMAIEVWNREMTYAALVGKQLVVAPNLKSHASLGLVQLLASDSVSIQFGDQYLPGV